jgi:hypothetical protein
MSKPDPKKLHVFGSAKKSLAAGRTYSTNFPLTENPISEGGNWINGGDVGLDWANIITTPGLAVGACSEPPYSDPTGLLTGSWGPDQTVQATVCSRNQTDNYYQEVEIRFRSSLSAHIATGYEILFRCLKTPGAYLEVVKWNGPLGNFTCLSRHNGSQYGVANGDVVKASIIGNVINVYINGKLVDTVTDNTYTTGNPGMGFNYGCGATSGDFGFTSFMATDGQ